MDNEGKWANFDSFFEKGNTEEDYWKNTLKEMLKDTFVDGFFLSEDQEEALLRFYSKYIETDTNMDEISSDIMKFFHNFLARFPLFGLSSAFKKFQTNEELLPHEENAVIRFSDKFTTCTLNSSTLKMMTDDEKLKASSDELADLVRQVNRHGHTKSCRKYDTICRFNFPKFPLIFSA